MKFGHFFQNLTYGSMILAAVACPVFTSCYDDTALNERLENVENDVEQIKSDLEALKNAEMNDLTVVDYNQIEGGYELVMSDGTKLNIYNGKDGAKGDKGDNGKDGANGNDGNDGQDGQDGDAFFESVGLSEDGAYLIITLVGGDVYELPLAVVAFNFVVTAPEAYVTVGETIKVNYTITGAAESDEVIVRVLNAFNCTAVVVPAEKVVAVTPQEGEGYVDLYAINNTTGELKAKTISFNGYTFDVTATSLVLSPLGGTVEVPVATSVDYDVVVSESWLTYSVETKAVRNETIVFSAEGNTTVDRTATVVFKMKDTERVLATFEASQKAYAEGLVGEYVETYSQYGQTLTGTLKIELSDDVTKGIYKVTICGTTLYADYEDGKLNCYDGKYTRTLTVASDFSKFEIADLSLGYKTYSNYVAFKPLGAPELTEAEQALVGVYNETWTHPNCNPATNGMEIKASEEASFGRLVVKFLVTEDGSAYTGYGTLESSELKVQIGGQSHPKFGTQWNPDVVLTLTVNDDGTLTMPTWTDANNKELSNYVATKYVEGGEDSGEDEEAGLLAGTWNVTCEMGDAWGMKDPEVTTGTMVITGSGNDYVIESIAGVPYGLSVTWDGTALSGGKNGATLTLVYDSASGTLTFNGEYMDYEHNVVKNIVATKK